MNPGKPYRRSDAFYTSAVIKARGEANVRDKLERKARMLDHPLMSDHLISWPWWRVMGQLATAVNRIKSAAWIGYENRRT